jgi:hypothetical protein
LRVPLLAPWRASRAFCPHLRLATHSRAGDIGRERFVSDGSVELDEPPVRPEVDALYTATDLAA